MLQEVLSAGGKQLLIPVILVSALMYLVNRFLDLERRQSERRREFLELWPNRRPEDDLWTDVALRHLLGAYLPKAVREAVLSLPDKAESLISIATIWDYLELSDGFPPRVRWKRKLYRSQKGRLMARVGFNAGYFILAFIGAALILGASRIAPPLAGALWGLTGAIVALVGISMLYLDHGLRAASESAPRWIPRLNELLGARAS